ncbi:MAG TPA: AmmeMemoRadiSam system protein B, partial [Planctomycetota bacterium]|nr:AmmeMemoRadiSam system protein B [Planctomycetota bacterium]
MRRMSVLLLSAAVIVIGGACAWAEGAVRQSVGLGDRGGWFPADPDTLRATVDRCLADAGDVKVEGKVLVVIAPHAGYAYSASTAGCAFKPVQGRAYKRVIVLAPSHRAGFSGASIADVDAYATPLGTVPLDKTSCLKLLAADGFRSHPTAHREEHSLQAELPFLQRTLADWKLVPVLMGPWQDERSIAKIADALRPLLTDDTLLVVSSDFTHYGEGDPFRYAPFKTDLKDNIRKLDVGAIDRICDNDYAGFRAYLAKTRVTICGREPISVVLKLFEGKKSVRGKLVRYANSGDATGDYRHAVSYAAIVISDVEATPL